MMHEIIDWICKNLTAIASITTIIALALFIVEMRRNQKRARGDRTFHLLEQYFESYHDRINLIDTPSLLELKRLNEDEYQSLRKKLQASEYNKFNLFLWRLTMYWRKDLLDKEMIKEQMGSTIVFESFVIEMTYREAHLNAGAINYLKKMSDEIARKPHRF